MAKVFTITEGLENLGAMKTGGQGSVYKGRRIGEIITAIKILPTPIYSESPEDKNYSDFQNEVQKLKKVNEQPNPHVVTILNSGITDSGNFPFIEMEYIEGPDLEELLKPPHERIFTIKETIKVAEQLANAISHCHRLNVRHGDIKSNNVKFNHATGNYILLDFGLSVMSDEERRSSLRHAGAIEFMAPEQNEGQMLFQTDVYSFGIIVFELLAGRVPFPLHDKGETARNAVRLSHMETPVPDVMQLRNENIPEAWKAEKRERELQVPGWIISMINKCLEKDPQHRFKDGKELYNYICSNISLADKNSSVNKSAMPPQAWLNEREQLQQQVLQYQQIAEARQEEIDQLRAQISSSTSSRTIEPMYGEPVSKGVSKPAFLTLLILTIGLAAFAVYNLVNKSNGNSTAQISDSSTVDSSTGMFSHDTSTVSDRPTKKKEEVMDTATQVPKAVMKPQEETNRKDSVDDRNADNKTSGNENDQPDKSAKYKVVSKAYFYDKPDEDTRRDAFIVHWNNAILTPLDEQDGFIYVVYTNVEGQTSKGWLRKKDLLRTDD